MGSQNLIYRSCHINIQQFQVNASQSEVNFTNILGTAAFERTLSVVGCHIRF